MPPPENPLALSLKRIAIWMIGQPEVVMRLARQELVNIHDQIDLPIHLRRAERRVHHELLFELDPSRRRQSGQLTASQLQTRLEENLGLLKGLEEIIIGMARMDIAIRATRSRREALDVVLACHQYQRRHGKLPQDLDQLVPEFLPAIPIDPMSPKGALIQYRLENDENAVIWSVGYDEIDDHGEFRKDESTGDIGYPLRGTSRSDTRNNKATPVAE